MADDFSVKVLAPPVQAFPLDFGRIQEMATPPQLNVFVICTMTKRFHGTGNRLLREVGGASLSERFGGWASRIERSRSPSIPAIDTYSGGHWSVVRSLNSSFAKSSSSERIWIVSAGYGLISPADAIIPYGATFAPGQPDSISPVSSPEASVAWWRLLTQWRPPALAPNAPRSVAAAVAKYPEASNLLVLSPDYYRALSEDLRASLSQIADPQKLIILSSDERQVSDLAAHTVRVDARLQTYVGGARSSLGVRTARAVLQELSGQPVTLGSFRAAMACLVNRHGVVQVFDREPMTDAQVADFINTELFQDASVSSTRLLEKLRGSGRACERKRFHKLFTAAKERRTASLFALNTVGA